MADQENDPTLDFLEAPHAADELGRLAFYRILGKLGEGATSYVLHAEDTRLHRIVALKVLKPEVARDEVARERFFREARAAASIHAEHVEHIHHVGQHQNLPFIELEYLSGETLGQRLKRGPRLELNEIVRIGREIAEGLQAAHAKGLMHRDIKPANVWLEPAGTVKVLDFGLARGVDPEDRVTEVGHTVGTPLYMSPEQLGGTDIDVRTDLYSLGCVIYEMVAGRVPIQRYPLAALQAAVASELPEPLGHFSQAVPPALDQLVQRLLAKQPIDRPQSAQEVVQSLQAIGKELAPREQPARAGLASRRYLPSGPHFVRRDQPSFEEETEQLLQLRLKTTAFVLACGQAFGMYNSVAWRNDHWLVLRLVCFGVTLGLAALLGGPRRFSLRQLRWWELGVFAPTLVWLLLVIPDQLLYFAEAGDRTSAVALNMANHGFWATLIMLYALLIPNTWQRAALIMLPVSLLPSLICVVLERISPAVRSGFQTVPFLYSPLHWSVLAGPTGVYAVYVLQTLRQQIFLARRMGAYLLHERLGAGEHGEVYRAEHVLLQRPCAVKLLRLGKDSDAADLERFEQTVRAAAALAHWNVIDIYDVGRADDEQFYYAMEKIDGLNLAELVERGGPVPAGRALFLLQQVCRALEQAHRGGQVHGNLKPTNVLLCCRGGAADVVKVGDFGALKGFPAYQAPEQLKESSALDGRSDIYSLGAVAYYLVTGKPPFTAPTAMEVLAAQLRDAPVPPSSRHADVPTDFEQVLLRCLQKEPPGRFQSMRALADALGSCQAAGTWTESDAARWWGIPTDR